MRISVKRKRLFTPPEDRRLTVRFDAGTDVTTKRAWGDRLVADGDAEEVVSPARASDESPPAKRPLSPAQIKALDGDGDGAAGGSLPKDQRAAKD